jgi:hypothetical protein
VIVCSVDRDGIDNHCCLQVIVRFVDLGGNDYHSCLEVNFRFVDLVELIPIAVYR